ncbi:MAG: glycosyltransferase family 2 protein, partial [Bacteroidota bacterium]
MTLPLVSILIPCHNAERWIKGAINSALAQDYSHKEVIIVDDGSTDNSWEIIQGYGPRIRAERTSNNGACAARNYLLQLSKGEWLQYLDADDYLLPGKISSQVKVLEHESDADILYGPGIIEEHWTGEINKYTLPISEPRDP